MNQLELLFVVSFDPLNQKLSLKNPKTPRILKIVSGKWSKNYEKNWLSLAHRFSLISLVISDVCILSGQKL